MWIRDDIFNGMMPKLDSHKLPAGFAQTVREANVYSAALKPFRSGAIVQSLAKGRNTMSIYPIYPDRESWLHWLRDVDAVKSPLENDTTGRTYYTGDNNPKSTNKALATASGTNFPALWYRLGLPSPEKAPTVGHTGGTAPPEIRSYVYTFVTEWGEEGPPSTATEHSAFGDTTSWDLSVMSVAPLNVFPLSSVVYGPSVITFTTTSEHHLETGEYVLLNEITVDHDGAAFDGSADHLKWASGLTGASSTASGFTMCMWFRPDGTIGAGKHRVFELRQSGGASIELDYDADDGYIEFTLYNSSAQKMISLKSNDGAFAPGVLRHVVATFQTTPTFLYWLYIDGQDSTDANNYQEFQAVSTIDCDGTVAYLAGKDVDTSDFEGAIAKFWFDDAYIDITVAANLQKFWNTTYGVSVYLGADGSGPTGAASIVMLDGDDTAFGTNGGSGPNATVVGSPAEPSPLIEENQFATVLGDEIDTAVAVTRTGSTTFTTALFDTAFDPDPAHTFEGQVTREAPINTSNMTKRIYRTDSVGDFRFVAEIPIAQTTYTDTVADDALGEIIPSTTWSAPPGDLHGIVSLPNGVLAGFHENNVHMTPPHIPHAWPDVYVWTADSPVIGLAVWGGSLVVLTEAVPYLITGVHPDTMAMDEVGLNQSCVSKRSIVKMDDGVMYACPDGVAYVGARGAFVMTEQWMRREEWQRYSPGTMFSTRYNDRYYGYYTNGDPAFVLPEGGIVIDPQNLEAGVIETSLIPKALAFKQEGGESYYVFDATLYQFDAGASHNAFYYRSRVFTSRTPVTMQAAKVRYELKEGAIPQDDKDAQTLQAILNVIAVNNSVIPTEGTVSGSAIGEYAISDGPFLTAVQNAQGNVAAMTFKLWSWDQSERSGQGDWVLRHTEEIADQRAFRMMGGYTSEWFFYEISAAETDIREVIIAETMSDLEEVPRG